VTDLGRHHDEWVSKLVRRIDEVEGLTAQTRILAVCGESIDGVVRAVTAQELQVFQREALESLEWKLERCVQWLHGANVKLGLNPQGTMFSTDRFREQLFGEAPVGGGSDQQHQPPATIRGESPSSRGGGGRRPYSGTKTPGGTRLIRGTA
jgi:hypothetical protein